MKMCFHSNQHPWATKHPFISLYSKYQSLKKICFPVMNSPVFPSLDDIYCTCCYYMGFGWRGIFLMFVDFCPSPPFSPPCSYIAHTFILTPVIRFSNETGRVSASTPATRPSNTVNGREVAGLFWSGRRYRVSFLRHSQRFAQVFLQLFYGFFRGQAEALRCCG